MMGPMFHVRYLCVIDNERFLCLCDSILQVCFRNLPRFIMLPPFHVMLFWLILAPSSVTQSSHPEVSEAVAALHVVHPEANLAIGVLLVLRVIANRIPSGQNILPTEGAISFIIVYLLKVGH